MQVVGEGQLRGQVSEFLKLVFSQDCVDAMVIGFEKVEEIDDAIKKIATAQQAEKATAV